MSKIFNLKEFRKDMKLSQDVIAEMFGITQGFVSRIENGKDSFPNDHLPKLRELYGEIVDEYLIDEVPQDIKFYDSENRPANKKLIPLYDDISTIGGRSRDANITSNSYPSEWIDPGDWFKSATAALRHYDDSMNEYPSGCILPLKEVYDRRLLVPGKDYVIETSEYRITKKLGKSEKPNHIKAHSTNEEKRDDGTLIHDSFDIDNELITTMYEVLGYVVKKGGGTIVYSNLNK